MADLTFSNHDTAASAYAGAGTAVSRSDVPSTYQPTPEEQRTVASIKQKFDDWRRDRSNYEPQWYINAAMFRGNHEVTWSPIDNRLISIPSINPSRARRKINRLFAKVRARRAKFTKNRPTWIVVPATSDVKDKLDARATGKVLDYLWRRLHLEAKYAEVVRWSDTTGRGFWWLGWDETAIGRVTISDPTTGQKTVKEGVVGEVTVEAGSPFEVLIDNPAASSLCQVDELIRAKERSLDWVRSHHTEKGQFVSAEPSGDTFQYESQIANLNSTNTLFGAPATGLDRKRDGDGVPQTVVVKEYFQRPTADFPHGRYCVIAGDVLLRETSELPFGLYDQENPFPVVEFVDVPVPGQFWSPTVLEQMIEMQREYNGIRSMISTNIKLMGHPKVFVAKQHQIPEGAWSPDAGEIIEFNARPGIPPPTPWVPPNFIADAWRLIELLRTEFDDVSQIFPESEGRRGGSESGFQTNLLQEASDAVHTPDLRALEMGIEEAAYKIRRIVKRGYSVPRLVSVTSSSYQPEIFEFSSEDVDEYADIVVQSGSAFPMLKSAKTQMALDLYAKGVFGDPADPNVRRRVLNVLDLGGVDDLYDYNRVDEDMINIENSMAEDAAPLAAPRFFENHQEHWIGHINRLKSPSVMSWPTEARMGLLSHAILHAMYINHAAAYQMSIEAGLQGLIPPPVVMSLPTGAGPGGAGMPGGSAGPGGPGQPPGAGPAGSPDTSFAEAPASSPQTQNQPSATGPNPNSNSPSST